MERINISENGSPAVDPIPNVHKLINRALCQASLMDACAASASQSFHGRFTNAKLQTATKNYVKTVLLPVQASVEVVKPAMDLTKMTSSKDAKSDQKQQGQKDESKAKHKAKRNESIKEPNGKYS